MLVSFQHNLSHQNQHSFVMHNHSLSSGYYHIGRTSEYGGLGEVLEELRANVRRERKLADGGPLSCRCSFSSDESEEQVKPFITECLPAGISPYGKAMLERPFELFDGLRPLTHELIFEMVRLSLFPHKPSRLASIFACHHDDLDIYMRCLNLEPYDGMQVGVTEAELPPDRCHIGDIHWLEKISTVAGGIYNARHYWQGDDRIDAYFKEPVKEYIIPAPAKGFRLLSPEDTDKLLSKLFGCEGDDWTLSVLDD